MKKIVALLLAATMLVALAACGNTAAPAETKAGAPAAAETQAAAAATATSGEKTLLKVGIDSTLDTLNPWATAKPSKSFICNTLYQPLGFADEASSDEIKGVLMKEWKQVDDYTYEVTLYDYIKDSEGNPFTSSDAIFSFEKYKELNACNFVKGEKVDDYTFKITLDSAVPAAFQTLCQDVLMITEAGYNACGDECAATACGTSPYKLRTFESGAKVVVEKVEDYWQKDESLNNPSYAANADVIEFDVLTELTQLSGAVEQGTVQMIAWADSSQIAEFADYSNLEVVPVGDTESRAIMLNMTKDSPFYDNLELRQAVLYAIDKDLLVENVTYGGGQYSDAIIFSEEVTNGFNPKWNESNPYKYDPEKAKELLEKAGYKEGELTIRLLCNNNKAIKTIMETIQSNLLAIGINAQVDTYDGSTYGGYRDGTSGMYEIAYCGAQQGGSVIKALDTVFNGNNRDSGGTWFGLVDKDLQKLYDDLTVPGGFTAENIDKIYNYIQDGAYYYQLFFKPTYAVYDTTKITGIKNDARNFLAFGAVELADGYDVFDK